MPVADIRDPASKFWWADQHLQRLDRRIAKFNSAHSQPPRVQIGSNPPWYIVRVLAFPPLPEEFALCVGDFLVNIRSALDHLVWQLVLREGEKTRSSHYFPIIGTDKEFIDKVRSPSKKAGKRSPLYGNPVDGDAWAIIEANQPFNRAERNLDYLSWLSKFVNRDKHRTLLARDSIVRADNIENFIGWRANIEPIERIESLSNLSPVQPTELIRYRFAFDPGIYMKRPIPVQPTFGDGESTMNIGVLQQIRFQVGEILNDVGALPNVEGLR
jgi:hypothetical protein